MAFVPEVVEQRERETKRLKRFLPFTFTSALALHLVLIPLLVLMWKPIAQPAISEEEIEIIADEQPDETLPDENAPETAQQAGGSGGGSEQFSLFNPNSASPPPADSVEVAQATPEAAIVPSPIAEPEVVEPEVAEQVPPPSPT
ncbi:hypothetical protein IQ250_21205, partial [Pseudanabaenaceae cyanobacterium LEGE 13415]|nr:hypothetical protein [Pseudanabaenaceae cyanobacterium LEGE 13415]